MKKSIANMVQVCTEPGITPAGTGIEQVEWSILGHTYWLKSEGESCFRRFRGGAAATCCFAR